MSTRILFLFPIFCLLLCSISPSFFVFYQRSQTRLPLCSVRYLTSSDKNEIYMQLRAYPMRDWNKLYIPLEVNEFNGNLDYYKYADEERMLRA